MSSTLDSVAHTSPAEDSLGNAQGSRVDEFEVLCLRSPTDWEVMNRIGSVDEIQIALIEPGSGRLQMAATRTQRPDGLYGWQTGMAGIMAAQGTPIPPVFFQPQQQPPA